MRIAGVWEAANYWESVPLQIDTNQAFAVINCTNTTNFADEYCEVSIKLNSLWNCAPVSGPFVPDASSPCTIENPFFYELYGWFNRDQLDPETNVVVTDLSETTGFIGEGCDDTVSIGSGSLFQLKFAPNPDGPDPKSFDIEVVNGNTGEVFPPSSNCASQTFYSQEQLRLTGVIVDAIDLNALFFFDGPEPPSPSPSTSSANAKGEGGLGGHFSSIFAVPVVVALLAALVPI